MRPPNTDFRFYSTPQNIHLKKEIYIFDADLLEKYPFFY